MSDQPTNPLGYLLHEVSRLMRKQFDQTARPLGMTRAQWLPLALIAKHEGIRQAQLAELVEVEPMTIARTVDRLEAAGLVRREPDPTDRRAYRLVATEAAMPLIEEIREVAKQIWRDALAGVSEEDQAALARALLAIKSNLSGRDATLVDFTRKDVFNERRSRAHQG